MVRSFNVTYLLGIHESQSVTIIIIIVVVTSHVSEFFCFHFVYVGMPKYYVGYIGNHRKLV